jgi:hypothetical protein
MFLFSKILYFQYWFAICLQLIQLCFSTLTLLLPFFRPPVEAVPVHHVGFVTTAAELILSVVVATAARGTHVSSPADAVLPRSGNAE